MSAFIALIFPPWSWHIIIPISSAITLAAFFYPDMLNVQDKAKPVVSGLCIGVINYSAITYISWT